MRAFRAFLRRLTALARARQHERDLDEQIASHLAEATDDYIARGLSRDEPRRAALRDFGGVTQTKQVHREVRSFTWPENMRQDLYYTLRSLCKAPGFTLVVVSTLALGIGVNTAIFTLLDAVVFKPLPVPAPHELVALHENGPEGTADVNGGSGRIAGITLGLVAATAAAGYLSTMLFGVTSRDPWTFVSVLIVFASVTTVAAFVPARRASAVDPVLALRHE